MHKIHEREFTLDDFSCEHLIGYNDELSCFEWAKLDSYGKDTLSHTICALNYYRKRFLKTKDKKYWWQMIQLLPSSYNQKRTVMMNYEVLANIYKSRKNHKLDEWREHDEIVSNTDSTSQAKYSKPYKEYFGFCDWIKTLPYSELITGEIE